MDLLLIIPLFAGYIAGLLINYLADVLPITRSFSQPVCYRCDTGLGTHQYILMQPCSNGHQRRPRSWVVIIIMMIISVYAWLSPPEKIGYILGLIVATYFGLVFVIDLEHRLILHPTSIFGAILGLIVGIIKRGFVYTIYGALGGLAIMLFFYFLGVLFARIRTRRMIANGQEPDDEEALGAGDVILVTILGLMLGTVIWFSLLIGILLGGVVSLALLLWLFVSGKYNKNALMMFIPYGPYFIVSASLLIYFPSFVQLFLPK